MSSIEDELGTLYGDTDWKMNLHARQVGPGKFVVLSARNGSPRRHKVNVWERECTCEDLKFNRAPPEICAHIAYCLLDPDERLSYEEGMAHNVWSSAERLQSASKRLERAATGTEADRTAEDYGDTTEDTEDSQRATDPSFAELDTPEKEERVRDWLEEEFDIDRDAGTVEIHPDYGSVNYDPNYEIEGDEFSALAGYLADLENSWMDDDGTAIVRPDDFGEVFDS